MIKDNGLTHEEIWELAIIINNSDGVMPSNYLKELILQNKRKEISNDEILTRLKEYYSEKGNRSVY